MPQLRGHPSGDRTMPVIYQLDPDAGFIDVRCSGDVTLEDVLEHFRQLEADPKLPDRLDVLLDVGAQTSVPERSQLRQITAVIEQLTAAVRWGACAIVASSDVLFGMSRMFEVFVEPLFDETRVFRDRETAERWLSSVRATAH